MQFLGIETTIKNQPKLDPNFIPIDIWMKNFSQKADQAIAIAVEREKGRMAVEKVKIYSQPEMQDANHYFIEQVVKLLLWMKGGFRIYICGDPDIYAHIAKAYSYGGKRDFDVHFMERVYSRSFEVCYRTYDQCPAENDEAIELSRSMAGCRIGFDAGGSDRKVSAIIDGKVVFSEEVVWFPKLQEDPAYHFEGIVSAFRSAAEHLPHVDGIGVSSAGVIVDHKPMVSSLFIKVPDQTSVEDIFLRAAKEIDPDIPIVVCNDGDVSALAGGYSLGLKNLIGMAMGTSEAVGFLNQEGNITGWLNELAFAPVDASPLAMQDEWSGDIGCGCKYFSQDAVIKLAPPAGIQLDENLPLAEKLKVIQEKAAAGEPGAQDIFTTIGTYLGHTLALYYDMYGCTYVLLLGRVMSGVGGELIYQEAERVLKDEYPQIPLQMKLPDENFRRLGQSAAAAMLPPIQEERK